MDDYRKDSVYLDFSGIPAHPKLDNVFELISKKIQLDMTKVYCIQSSMTKARVIIELKSHAYVEELVAEHSMKHTVDINNKEYDIPLIPYDNAIEVRVADLPSYLSAETIAKHLAPYGEVLSTQVEVWKNYWPGLPTGVRLVRMRIQKPIPSYIPVTTHTAYITYRNQTRTCRYCVRPLHIGRTCNEVRKELGLDINSRLTAAKVVKGIQPTTSTLETTAPPLSSSPQDTANQTQTSDGESNIGIHETLVNAITDCIKTTATKQLSRPSSLSRLPMEEGSQVAGSSKTTSPFSNEGVRENPPQTMDFEISDDDEETTNTSKRHRSQKTLEVPETPFLEVKRKSRRKTNDR